MINVEHATSEKLELYTFGQKGQISNILPNSTSTSICVEWTRFSLKQLCQLITNGKKKSSIYIIIYYHIMQVKIILK